jgi:hypothetical protein
MKMNKILNMIMNKKLTGLLLGLMLSALSGTASALIILSGDSNIGNAIDGSFGAPLNTDNQTWFSNILGSGTTVQIQDEYYAGSVFDSTNAINNYYNGLGGVSSSLFSGTITDYSLRGVDLFLGILPNNSYSVSEIGALQNFLGGGGTLFLLGENNVLSTQNNRINTLLTALGSSMSLGNLSLDTGFHTTTNIDADPLNTGVSDFTYALTNNVVSGGTSLIRTINGTTFIAYESTVPEPSVLALLGLGLAGIGFARKRIKT